MSPRKSYLLDHWIGFVLAFVYLVVLVKTAHPIGYARDEGFYFNAASSYAGWFDQLMRDPAAAIQRSAVDAHWSANHEHPGLVKSMFGLSWDLLYKKWHLFSEEGTSFRFGGMLFASTVGLFFIPLLYVVVQGLTYKLFGQTAAAVPVVSEGVSKA